MPISMRVEVDLSGVINIENQSPGEIDEFVGIVAYKNEDDMKRHFSPHSPSSPGDPPAVVTGMLKNSINVVKVGWAAREVRIGTEYAEPLEWGTYKMAARPFALPSAERTVGWLIGHDKLIPQSIKDMD